MLGPPYHRLFYDQQGLLRTYSLPGSSIRSPHPGSPRGAPPTTSQVSTLSGEFIQSIGGDFPIGNPHRISDPSDYRLIGLRHGYYGQEARSDCQV